MLSLAQHCLDASDGWSVLLTVSQVGANKDYNDDDDDEEDG